MPLDDATLIDVSPDFDLHMPQVAARLFGTPLLIEQAKLDTILAVLGPRMGFENRLPASAEQARVDVESRLMAAAGTTKIVRQDEGHFVAGKTAIVPVVGTLVQRGGWMSAMSGMVSYQRVQAQLQAAMNDGAVENILLELDTPGGEVAGAFDFADYLHSLRGQKPIIAHANELAASAGYLIASAADEVVVNRTARVGSIGVVVAHLDRSAALNKAGLAVTYIYAGDKKIDGNPNQPLNPRVTAEIQASVNETYELFVATVARNTGLKESAIRATQAGVYAGRAAVDAGLAKRVNTFANELSILVSRQGAGISRLKANSQEGQMAGNDKPDLPAEQLAAAKAEGHAAGVAEGVKQGAEQERARIKAIVENDEAKDRTALASHLAFNTEMAVEQAVSLLAKAEKTSAALPAGKTSLKDAMAGNGTPGITTVEAPQSQAAQGSWGATVKKFGG